MITVEQSTAFEANVEIGISGLAGTLTVAVIDNDGVVVLGPTTTNISENLVAGNPTGNYTWNAPAAPGATGQYQVLWSTDGSFDPDTLASEDLVVVLSTTTVPIGIPPPAGGGPAHGPCSAWTTADDVAACCSVAIGSDTSVLDDAVAQASQLLFELSGRVFAGLCSKTVRPCRTKSCACDWQTLSRGHIVWSGSVWTCQEATPCGCRGLSRVLLSGYPVRTITQVKIAGVVVDPKTYRLDENRWLTRIRDPADPDTVLLWPGCQNLDLPDTEVGTFSVTYTYGQEPPFAGIEAARQLACEIYKQCAGEECQLPAGATRVSRQGITIERSAFRFDPRTKTWRTGLYLVDVFLNSVNPNGLRRRPAIWSPASHLQYARPAGGA